MGVPRTDENGRQLKALLGYLLDGEVDAKEIYDALGVSSSTYYRRIKEQDYPNAEELRLVADRFNLSYPGPFAVEPVTAPTTATRGRTRLSELKPRSDAPPL
jgi:hypothetical protein